MAHGPFRHLTKVATWVNLQMDIDIVVIGHFGTEKVITPFGEAQVLGGAAYYSAIAARMLGANVGAVTTVGRDYPIDQISSLDIDTRGINVVDARSTHFNISYLPTFNDRNVEVIHGAGSIIKVDDLPANYIKASYFHIATNLPRNQQEIMLSLRKAGCKYITVECFDKFIIAEPDRVCEILNLSNLFFASEKEEELLRKLPINSDIPRIIKRSSRGAEYISPTYRVSVPAPKAILVDPTGAGDVLAGCFLGGLALGYTIEMALRKACEMATHKVESYGIEALIETYLIDRI
jgi:ribokinase